MRYFSKAFIISLMVGAALLTFFWFQHFLLQVIKAGAEANVSGWPWSENIGWISFNSANCDPDGNGKSNGNPAGCPAAGTTIANYGVNIDPATGNFSGYDWSENIGWISFAPSGPYPGAPAYSAKLDIASNQVTGWARALAYGDGWDGWIKMSGTATDGSSYGVTRSGCDLIGYAWGSDVVGWIKFNSSNYKVVTTFCESVNQRPSADKLQSSISCCSNICTDTYQTGLINFSWRYQDPEKTNQSQYQIQARRTDGTVFVNCSNGNAIDQNVVPSGKTGTSQIRIVTSPTAALCDMSSFVGDIPYGGSYEWRVRVSDSDGNWSDWSDWTSINNGNPIASHSYPCPDFSWNPQSPATNEKTQFTDSSTVYGGATKSAWSWTFQNGNPANSSIPNPVVKFLSSGAKSVTLEVTDSDGFSCQAQKTINSQLPLPSWKEISPF